MMRYAAVRLIQFPLILAVIYVATFFLTWVIPGSPFERTERRVADAALKAMAERFHADDWRKFMAYYPLRALRGDFGQSMKYQDWSVTDIIRQSLPVSVTLGLFALTIAVFVGVATGVLAAVRRGGIIDSLSVGLALAGISVPSFVVASLLLVTFCVRLKWFSIGQWGTPADMVLPGVALSLLPMAYIARLSRVAMLDVLGSDFVRTARAKGLPRATVIWKHCLKHALLPVLSFLGPAAAGTLTGSFVVEKVFNIPGLGQHFVNSVLNKDQTMILAVVMIYSVMLLTFNLLVDLCYALLDPRIEVGAKAQ